MKQVTVLDSMSDSAKAALKLFEAALREIGPFVVEPKKTSIHFRPGEGRATGPAFAGARLLKSGLRLTLVMQDPPQSRRLVKCEQVSKSRWHAELILETGDSIDGELAAWLREAYALQRSRA